MFLNELENNDKQNQAIKDLGSFYHSYDNVLVFPEYVVKTENMPKELKENNFQIHRGFRFVSVSYDEALEKSVIKDIRTNSDFDLSSFSSGASYGKEIYMTDLVLIMKKDDYNLAKTTSDAIMALPHEERGQYADKLSQKELSLAHIYFTNIDVESRSKGYYFAHEAHHGITNLKIEQSGNKVNPRDYYKSCEDSEKSAYFAEILKVREAYYKSNDYDNFKVFPGTRYNWLKDELKKLSTEQRLQKLNDMDFIINSSNQYWDFANNEFYKREGGQFEVKTKEYVQQNPDSSHGTKDDYLARKEIYYTFDVYNHKTGRYEKQNLAPKINTGVIINSRGEEFLSPYSQDKNEDAVPKKQEEKKHKLSIKDIFKFKTLYKRGSK